MYRVKARPRPEADVFAFGPASGKSSPDSNASARSAVRASMRDALVRLEQASQAAQQGDGQSRLQQLRNMAPQPASSFSSHGEAFVVRVH